MTGASFVVGAKVFPLFDDIALERYHLFSELGKLVKEKVVQVLQGLAVFVAGIGALDVLAITNGKDSRDGRDWTTPRDSHSK